MEKKRKEKIICIIGARGGSKGVPRKNIRKLYNKPLIGHTIESALSTKIFDHVVVSTEDKEIAKISKKFGAEIPFMRPKKLATDKSGMLDVLLHALKKFEMLNYQCDILVSRDCTVPFIRKKDIVMAVNLLKKQKSDAVFGVYKQHLNPYFNMVEKRSNGYLKISKKPGGSIKRRQDAPIVYQLNGLMIFNTKQFLKYKNAFMPKILPYEIPPATGLMIDTEAEFQFAEMILKNNMLQNLI